MEQKLTLDEIEKRFAEIDTMDPEEPIPEDLAAFAEADAEDPAETVTLEEYKAAAVEKAERNAAFLGKLERGLFQVQAGQGIVKTMDELEAMAKDAERILEEFASDYDKMAK